MNPFKSIMLNGRALDLAREINTEHDAMTTKLRALQDEAMKIRQESHDRCKVKHEEIKALLGLKEEDSTNLEITYVKEHGVAFLQIPLESEEQQEGVVVFTSQGKLN